MIVSCIIEAFGEDIIGNLSILGKDIGNFPGFEIDPTATFEFTEVVFVDEFFRDVGEADTFILKTIKRSSQVNKFHTKGENLAPCS